MLTLAAHPGYSDGCTPLNRSTQFRRSTSGQLCALAWRGVEETKALRRYLRGKGLGGAAAAEAPASIVGPDSAHSINFSTSLLVDSSWLFSFPTT